MVKMNYSVAFICALLVAIAIAVGPAPSATPTKHVVPVAKIAPEVCEHNGNVTSAWSDQYNEIHVVCSSGVIQLVSR